MYHEPTLNIIPCCVDRMIQLDNTALCLSLAGSNPHQRYDHGFFVLHVTAYPSLAEWYNFKSYPCASPWQELTLTSGMTVVSLSYMSLHTPHWQLFNSAFQNDISCPDTDVKKCRNARTQSRLDWKKRRPLNIAQLFDDSIIALTNQSKVTAHAQCLRWR